MDLIRFSIHYYNPFPQTHIHTRTHTHMHAHTHTHTHSHMRKYIGFSYINLLASKQGCKKQNICNVSYIYVMELLYMYVATFSPISDTSPLLSWIIDEKFLSILCQHCVWSHSLILSKLYLKVQLGYNFFGYIFVGSIYAPKFAAVIQNNKFVQVISVDPKNQFHIYKYFFVFFFFFINYVIIWIIISPLPKIKYMHFQNSTS